VNNSRSAGQVIPPQAEDNLAVDVKVSRCVGQALAFGGAIGGARDEGLRG